MGEMKQRGPRHWQGPRPEVSAGGLQSLAGLALVGGLGGLAAVGLIPMWTLLLLPVLIAVLGLQWWTALRDPLDEVLVLSQRVWVNGRPAEVSVQGGWVYVDGLRVNARAPVRFRHAVNCVGQLEAELACPPGWRWGEEPGELVGPAGSVRLSRGGLQGPDWRVDWTDLPQMDWSHWPVDLMVGPWDPSAGEARRIRLGRDPIWVDGVAAILEWGRRRFADQAGAAAVPEELHRLAEDVV